MNHLGITLQQLKAFQAVASARSFTAGAKSINLTQSAVSHSVMALETALGVTLFDRGQGTRAYELAQAGRRILPMVTKILADIEHLPVFVEDLQDRPPRANAKTPKPSGKRYTSVAAMKRALKGFKD